MVQYISCKICGSDNPRFLGIRGNLEYSGAQPLKRDEKHIVTNVVRCRKCGFVYINPFISEKNFNRSYANPEEYNASADNVDPKELFNYTFSLIKKHACDKGTLLDVGCGKGEFLYLVKEKGWQVYGIEPSENLAAYAATKYRLDIKLNIENAGFKDSFFDVVTLNMALEHIDNPKDIILEIKRVLKKNGLLFIEVPNMDSLMLRLATLYFRLNRKDWSPLLSPLHHPYHSYGYNISSLRFLLEQSGFKIKKFIIRDSSMRGVRNKESVSWIEKHLCRFVSRIAGFIGRGDVLMAIVVNND